MQFQHNILSSTKKLHISRVIRKPIYGVASSGVNQKHTPYIKISIFPIQKAYRERGGGGGGRRITNILYGRPNGASHNNKNRNCTLANEQKLGITY